jgi:flavin reductase (DIM6/NTAB) family NADH-FMN oxidoreductase RutF
MGEKIEKKNIGRNIFIYPMPVTLVGAIVENKPNFMAVGWISRINASPPLLAVGLNKSHYTPAGIRKNKTFSVNFPSTVMVEQTDYCGLVSGRNTDKSSLFDIFYGELKTAPMIKSCHLCLECKLFDIYEMPSNDLFIGEIMAGYADANCLIEGKLDLHKLDPLLLTMPDNRYWKVGEFVEKAWSIGKRRIVDSADRLTN